MQGMTQYMTVMPTDVYVVSMLEGGRRFAKCCSRTYELELGVVKQELRFRLPHTVPFAMDLSNELLKAVVIVDLGSDFGI